MVIKQINTAIRRKYTVKSRAIGRLLESIIYFLRNRYKQCKAQDDEDGVIMWQAANCPLLPQATPLTRGAPLLSLTRQFPRFAGELLRKGSLLFAFLGFRYKYSKAR